MRYRNVRMVQLLGLMLLGMIVGACGGTRTVGPCASGNATPGAAAVTGASAPTASTTRTLETTNLSVRLLWVPQYQFAGYIVAKVKGFYDEAGLNVTLNPGGPEIATVPLVSSGRDSFGVDT